MNVIIYRMKKEIKNKRIFGIIFTILFIFVAYIVFNADSGKSNIFFDFVKNFKYGDKIGHFFIFGTLSIFLNFYLNKVFLKYIPLGSVLIFAVTIIEEFSQKFFPSRTFDYFDLLADFLGISFFGIIWIIFFLKK